MAFSESSLRQVLKSYLWKTPVLENVPLSSYTSFRCLGEASFCLYLQDEKELEAFLKLQNQHKFCWLILGRGSNTLFTDQGLKGVLCLLKGDFQKIERSADNPKIVEAGAGVINRSFSLFLERQALSGGEFLCTIPGNLGGSLVMNAGAFGQEMKDITQEVVAYNLAGEKLLFAKDACRFSYRHSIFQTRPHVLAKAKFLLTPSDSEAIQHQQNLYIETRRASQPVKAATWGSVFKNPPNNKAGALIEAAGLKGRSFGQLTISPKHANFIENIDEASFDDILLALQTIYSTVLRNFGIKLELEVKIYDQDGKTLNPFTNLRPL